MKKKLILILCMSIIFVLAGCSNSSNNTEKEGNTINDAEQNQTVNKNSEDNKNATKENDKINEDNKEKDIISNENNKKSNQQADSKAAEKNTDSDSKKKKDSVKSKVQLYEGTYFDDKRFGENLLKDYCEIEISNITDTSFDFTIYEVKIADEKEERKTIFLKNTAVFIDYGTEAAFYGKDYTLNFKFPDNHLAYPVVTDMQISGFKPLEGNTYVNNGIPGHEFG